MTQCPTQGDLIIPGFHLKILFVFENISLSLSLIHKLSHFPHFALL